MKRHCCTHTFENCDLDQYGYGPGAVACCENAAGEFVVGGRRVDLYPDPESNSFSFSFDEYANPVNYCPFCGAKAPKQFVVVLDAEVLGASTCQTN